MPSLQRIEEISDVILMVGLIGLADRRHAARPQVMLICSLREIFEWLVMGNVVSHRRHEVVSRQSCMMSAAHCSARRVYTCRRESALKPLPHQSALIASYVTIGQDRPDVALQLPT